MLLLSSEVESPIDCIDNEETGGQKPLSLSGKIHHPAFYDGQTAYHFAVCHRLYFNATSLSHDALKNNTILSYSNLMNNSKVPVKLYEFYYLFRLQENRNGRKSIYEVFTWNMRQYEK